MRHYVNFSLLFFFATLVVTGLLRFVRPFDLTTTHVHIVAGFCLTVLVLLHLIARPAYFRWILQRDRVVARAPPRWRLLAIAAGLWAIIFAATIYNWRPMRQLLEQGHEARNRAIIFRPESRTASRLVDNGFESKRVTVGDAELKIEIDWGSEYQAETTFTSPFNNAKPQIAIWAEGPAHDLIETFYISEESAFSESVTWDRNPLKRVNILPVWRHRYTLVSGIEPTGAIDAYSSATPAHSFSIEDYLADGGKAFYLNVEVNIPGDTNTFYHPNQDEGAAGYSLPGVGQPSVIYSVYINPEDRRRYYLLDLIGHGGSSREQDGKVFYNLDHITTASRIIDKILVRVDFH